MRWKRWQVWSQGSVLVFVLIGWAVVSAEPLSDEIDRKPSSYAPSRDLEYQISFFLDRIQDDLNAEAEYDARAKRVVKDANTIAVLALVLGKHDDVTSGQRPAREVIDAALRLANQAEKLAEAKAAYAALVKATKTPGNAATLEWKSVGNIQELMLQVPLLNTSLRGAVRSKQFSSSMDKAAGLAATLAAISQVSMLDSTYCGDDADRREWIELCALMRDASKEVLDAVRRGDQEAATETLKPLMRTCDDCHDQFRD